MVKALRPSFFLPSFCTVLRDGENERSLLMGCWEESVS